jgi:DNA-binding MarR family transcriptional regulator
MDRALFDIRRAGVSYAAHAAKILGRWKFTHSRVDVFMIHTQVLAYHGVVFQSDLGARLGIARSTLSVMMQRLERRGYITRHRAEHDRRHVVVTITPLGRKLFAELRGEIGPQLLTPYVDAHLLFHGDFKVPVALKRKQLLGIVGVIRRQFHDFSSGPYP